MKTKEGGVMDIQKEREAFLNYIKKEYPLTYGDISDSIDVMHHFKKEFNAWIEAKAQAVPKGYKLVPIDSVAVNKKEIPAIREALHIMNFKYGDVRDDFASADAAIEKAIKAAQEPAK